MEGKWSTCGLGEENVLSMRDESSRDKGHSTATELGHSDPPLDPPCCDCLVWPLLQRAASLVSHEAQAESSSWLSQALGRRQRGL